MLRKVQFSEATGKSMLIASQQQENDENVFTGNFQAPISDAPKERHEAQHLPRRRGEDKEGRVPEPHQPSGFPLNLKNVLPNRLRPRYMKRSVSFDCDEDAVEAEDICNYDEADDPDFIPRWECEARQQSLVEQAWEKVDEEVSMMKYFNSSTHHIPDELGQEIDAICDQINGELEPPLYCHARGVAFKSERTRVLRTNGHERDDHEDAGRIRVQYCNKRYVNSNTRTVLWY